MYFKYRTGFVLNNEPCFLNPTLILCAGLLIIQVDQDGVNQASYLRGRESLILTRSPPSVAEQMNVIISRSPFRLILISALQLTGPTSLCAVRNAGTGAHFYTFCTPACMQTSILVVWSGSPGNRYVEEVTKSTDVD